MSPNGVVSSLPATSSLLSSLPQKPSLSHSSKSPMDSYTPLLEKTRVPQPSLQKYAVISIFSKLRSAPSYLDSDSEPGRDAISQCLRSAAPAVVDQSVRELCRLVADNKIDIRRGFLELQSALEGSDSKFVSLFVKGLGFLVRSGFQKNNDTSYLSSPDSHPFVKILSCRNDVEAELEQQVVLFMAQNKRLGMAGVCKFLRPFLHYSVLRIPFSDKSSMFTRSLISSLASLCCSMPLDAIPVLKLLMECLQYVRHKSAEDFRNFIYFAESIVDAYTVVLKHLAGNRLLIAEAQLCGLELSEKILSICTDGHRGSVEPVVELSKNLFMSQKQNGFPYVPKLSSVMLSLFTILVQTELEHEQLSLLKLLYLLLKWKYGNEIVVDKISGGAMSEELLFIFPVVGLLSSPSKHVKGTATDLLVMLEQVLIQFLIASKHEPAREGHPSLSTSGSIVNRILQHLWFQDSYSLSSLFLKFASCDKTKGKEIHNVQRSWASHLREYNLSIVDKRKASLPLSQSQEVYITEMPPLLSAIVGLIVTHELLGEAALDSLAAIGIMDPKLGAQILLAILFYNNLFTRKNISRCTLLPKLLTMLPALASQSVMIPLVVQTILPMLQKDAKPTLHATAIRLLCQTWEINDRAFGSLQGVLVPKRFTDLKSERNICISMAASVRDVCTKNPDRGVDLILSVSACIENKDPFIQSFGLQSLAHLCEADVIDFYTAWDVIRKHILDYTLDPNLAHSLCLLLRWGAMDAEAHPEASKIVLQTLWSVSISAHPAVETQWAKARASSFKALAQYEVSHVEQHIQDFRKKNLLLLSDEANITVLNAMEELLVKIITHEHLTRRRFVKEKRVAGSKIEKLLDVFPQVIFSSGKRSEARELSGAALLCLSFTPKDVNTQEMSRGLRDIHGGYENALAELASSLHLSRNIFVALISLESWKSFMRRWLRADVLSFDAKVPSIVSDKIIKSASDILKSVIKIAEGALPRSAENIALAVGALCAVLPPSAHTVKSAASKFLLTWLVQHEHEHRIWSSAISLGLISSCLHVTDHKQKIENITKLVEVMCSNKSTLVKGACGVGLGFSCQDLLTRVDDTDNSGMEKNIDKLSEKDLLGEIIKALILMISQITEVSADISECLSVHFPPSKYDIGTDISAELLNENCDNSFEDIWGIAGLVLGLASSVSAMYRAGAHDVVFKIKDLIVSWVPHMNKPVQGTGSYSGGSEIVLSVGACLAIPVIVAFCQRVELMDNNEVDHILNGYIELISELLSVKKSGTFYNSLLMASCIGAGSLLACVLNEGVHAIEVEHIKDLLELFRKCYSSPYPPLVHFGGMLGVINAMGAAAGILLDRVPLAPVQTDSEQKDSSYVMGPLLSNPACEQHLTSLMQDIFLVAQKSDDHQLQEYAAWAASFLRNHLLSKDVVSVDHSMSTDSGGSKSVTQSFADDSMVMKLSSWLMHLNFTRTGDVAHVSSVIMVVRCLTQAPRLPTLDWGSIIRRGMRYEAQYVEMLPTESSLQKGILREECLKFSLAHANKFDPLLSFLDELSDLSRFSTLELNLQTCVLSHLADFIKVFSGSRLERLFDDLRNYFSSATSHQSYDTHEISLLRITCWKGLYKCLDEVSLDSLEYIFHIEKCMEVLFSILPATQLAAEVEVGQLNSLEEWSEAVTCLGKARKQWLMDFLHVSPEGLQQRDEKRLEVLKKIQAKAKLVIIGAIPATELGRLKVLILNTESHGIWDMLVEVVAASQHAEGSIKRQWLVDAVEISCVSTYPSTALKFLGLLCGSWSKYMPLLIVDQQSVLSDLPVTLPSLLSISSWGGVVESVASSLFASTERIYDWTTHGTRGQDGMQPIDESEKSIAVFLLRVMHSTCVCLLDLLSPEKQLRLANMDIRVVT